MPFNLWILIFRVENGLLEGTQKMAGTQKIAYIYTIGFELVKIWGAFVSLQLQKRFPRFSTGYGNICGRKKNAIQLVSQTFLLL